MAADINYVLETGVGMRWPCLCPPSKLRHSTPGGTQKDVTHAIYIDPCTISAPKHSWYMANNRHRPTTLSISKMQITAVDIALAADRTFAFTDDLH